MSSRSSDPINAQSLIMTQKLTLFRAIIVLPRPTVIAASYSENGADDNDAKTTGVKLLVLKQTFLTTILE